VLNIPPGNYVQMSVIDTGEGISEQDYAGKSKGLRGRNARTDTGLHQCREEHQESLKKRHHVYGGDAS